LQRRAPAAIAAGAADPVAGAQCEALEPVCTPHTALRRRDAAVRRHHRRGRRGGRHRLPGCGAASATPELSTGRAPSAGLACIFRR